MMMLLSENKFTLNMNMNMAALHNRNRKLVPVQHLLGIGCRALPPHTVDIVCRGLTDERLTVERDCSQCM
jgi:hypothetical protein